MEDVLDKAQLLMRRIITRRQSPEPFLLHSLASILEQEESKYQDQACYPCTNNSRSSHSIGRLMDMIREDDYFFELVSFKFIVEPGHALRLRAAAARLLLACVSCWTYPHAFEELVLVSIKQWVVEDVTTVADGNLPSISGTRSNSKPFCSFGREMLRTYATGLLAVALQGGDVVENILPTGTVGKLMHYLRMRVLGGNGSAGDTEASDYSKRCGGPGSVKVKGESREKVRLPADALQFDDVWNSQKVEAGNTLENQESGSSERKAELEGKRTDGGLPGNEESLPLYEAVDVCSYSCGIDDGEGDRVGEVRRRPRDRHDIEGRIVAADPPRNQLGRKEDADEIGREETSKRRHDMRNGGGGEGIGKGSTSDGCPEIEEGKVHRSGISKMQSGGSQLPVLPHRVNATPENIMESGKDMTGSRNSGLETLDIGPKIDMDENFTLPCVMVGNVDVGVIMQRAAAAAEAEAGAADAPSEAVKAAGDAAAELVKAAAIEGFALQGTHEAVLAAARAAAATVVDAAKAVHVNDNRGQLPYAIEEQMALEATDPDYDLAEEGICGIKIESLAKLRDLYSVQCLEKMGEYLEALGPVLHERGVDVCLALLDRESKDMKSRMDMNLLSDVLKLICSLAAHRKFASLLVDRGGVQRLLSTPRVPQTFTGISFCLFALSSLQGVMERVCTQPPAIVQEIVRLGLQLLGCSQDAARRNAALFFSASFVFRAILDAFDVQDGLPKVLNLLATAAHLRCDGIPVGGSTEWSLSQGDRGLVPEVPTSSGKQIAYHTCVALHQYFRAHLLVLVDSLRPSRGHRVVSRSSSIEKAVYKPADLSNEAMDAIILQLQRDRKLGPAFVRSHWTELEKFIQCGAHTMLLELTQAAPNERLHEICQQALGVLQIVTLMPFTRKLVVGSTLSNERTGMAVILDATSGAGVGYDPDVIQSALLVLVNLVCPPPSLCSRPILPSAMPAGTSYIQPGTPCAGFTSASGGGVQLSNVESKDRSGKTEAIIDRNGNDRNSIVQSVVGPVPEFGIAVTGNSVPSTVAVVGDLRISLGPGAGGSGLAAYMEQGYRFAREAVRANNGIKVLLHLLYPRQPFPPGSLDCIRALACRALLGLARDNAIAHILTKLQVGKLLSELLRDGTQAGVGGEQGRWQAELSRVALELIAIVTTAGRASTLAASEAAAPTLRRIERAAIAAATPISYHSRELLQLIHEHLLVSGLHCAASTLLSEAQLNPLPPNVPSALLKYTTVPTRSPSGDYHWPCGRISGGFLSSLFDVTGNDEIVDVSQDSNSFLWTKSPCLPSGSTGAKASLAVPGSSRRRPIIRDPRQPITQVSAVEQYSTHGSGNLSSVGSEILFKEPAIRSALPLKRKTEKELLPVSPIKRFAHLDSELLTPSSFRLKGGSTTDAAVNPNQIFQGQRDIPTNQFAHLHVPLPRQEKLETWHSLPYESSSIFETPMSPPSFQARCQNTFDQAQVPASGKAFESRGCPAEHTTLDSLVVQYLKHQHRQCPAPITTLPPLSLLHPHACPEPSRALDAPFNTTVRLASREIKAPFGGVHGRSHDHHFVYSRFRPLRTCRDEGALLTAITFLDAPSYLAAGSHAGEIRLFDSSSGNILGMHICHTSPITVLHSAPKKLAFGGEGFTLHSGQLLLSSASFDTSLWDSSMMFNGALCTFEGCRAARFNHSGSKFGAIGLDSSQKEVLLYDVNHCKLDQRLSDASTLTSGQSRGHTQAVVHFSPSDVLVLWSGVLWDYRIPRAVHRFDQFSDYGGGGFHPAGNEIIINSEVWDMRSFKLLRSVPSLDQTTIAFNATGDVIYATLRRNLDDIMAALSSRRVRHPLFAAFRTMDAVDYSDIVTIPSDRCVLDLATDSADSLVALVSMDSNEEMDSFVRVYDVGRRRPTDDDSDPDDGGETEEEESEADLDELHGDDDSDLDLISNDDPSDDVVDDNPDGDSGETSEDSSNGQVRSNLDLISEDEDDSREVMVL